MNNKLRTMAFGNLLVWMVVAVYLFLLPAGILLQDLHDPGLRSGEIPAFAFRRHEALTRSYLPWARERVASGRAKQLGTQDISGTEWPIFSSVFYLWATEALQEAWEKNPSLAPTMPKSYAGDAIEAAAALVADPNHAAWVKEYWGNDYLHREDLFYRMLLISGLTSYQKLSGKDTYTALLRDQVESLARELDKSPYGLLDDYPGQCYPIDILPAIAAIRRADSVLGTDHSAFADRALRAFQDTRLDPQTGLPAYMADSQTGQGIGPARGVGLSFMLTWAPELWPQTAKDWYQRYETDFWQQDGLLAGFREFSKDDPLPGFLLLDVDAGPVIAGYSTGASAFGIGAARVNGHMEQAYLLGAQALAASWPLPDGTLLMPRLLSNLSDAPYVGEAAMLFSFTRTPVINAQAAPIAETHPPLSVYVMLSGYDITGLALIYLAILRTARILKEKPFFPDWHFVAWLCLVTGGLALLGLSLPVPGGLLLVLAQCLPRVPNKIKEGQ